MYTFGAVMLITSEKREQSIPTRLTSNQVRKIDRLVKRLGLRSRSEFIREAIDHYINEVGGMKVIEIREVSVDQAKKEIVEYLEQKSEADTFEIANDLRLTLDLTTKALKDLWEGGRIK